MDARRTTRPTRRVRAIGGHARDEDAKEASCLARHLGPRKLRHEDTHQTSGAKLGATHANVAC